MSKQTLGTGLTFLILAVFLQQIGFEYLSSQGMNGASYVAVAILLTAATLWVTEAVPLFVTSLVVLLLSIVWLLPEMEAAGMEGSKDDFLAPFFSDVIVLFLGGFTLSSALHKHQIDELIAARIIERAGNTLPRLMISVMAVTACLSMWLSNTATAAMMLAMVIPIASRLGPGDPRGKAILLSVPFAANVGGLGTPIGSPPNAIAMQYMLDSGIAPSFAQWMVIGIPGVVVMLVLAWAVLLFLYRDGNDLLPALDHKIAIDFDFRFWVILTVVVLTAVGWVTTSFHGFSSGTVALIPVISLFALGILDIKDLHNMSWEVLLMMGGGLCLGVVIAGSGLADWLVELLPISGISIFGLTVLFGVMACVMSSVMSNTATANLLMPIIIGLSVETNAPIMVGTAFGCSLAMPLPISTPPNAMAFSSGKINVMDLAKPGVLLTALGVALALTTGYWWWDIVGIW